MHYVVRSKSSAAPQILNLLLESGGDPNAVAKLGLTPVHVAALSKCPTANILKFLLNDEENPPTH